MKISIKYLFSIFLVFGVFVSLSISADGQAVSQIKKTWEINKITKPQIINFNELKYSGNITTNYNNIGIPIKRGVYARVYKGNQIPETWITKNLKLSLNGVNIPKKNHNYFFDNDVNNLNKNLNLVLSYTNNNNVSTVFSGTGIEKPVLITFPPKGYEYNLGKVQPASGRTILNSGKRIPGLKVSWTPTTDEILVWLYNNGNVIKELTPGTNLNYVRFPRTLFKPGENYSIRIFQKAGKLTLSGKFKSGSYIYKYFLIWCNIKTK